MSTAHPSNGEKNVAHEETRHRQVLYEAKLAGSGRKLTIAGLVVLSLWLGAGLVLCFVFDTFPDRLSPLVIFVLGAIGLGVPTFRAFKMSKSGGYYRISIDDAGLYVHSDSPSSAPSFSVSAPDIYRLVRRTVKGTECGDEYEYFVESKSGERNRIEKLFTDYDLNATEVFQKIAARFPWAKIVEEVVP